MRKSDEWHTQKCPPEGISKVGNSNGDAILGSSLISLMSWFACLISLFGHNWMDGMMPGSVANGESGFWEQRELRIAPIWIFSFQSSCSAGIGNAMSALQIGILSHIAENVKNLLFFSFRKKFLLSNSFQRINLSQKHKTQSLRL